ncbi:MAG: zinc ABC transporter substrate-binding protein [Candidatus Neomarinimicrobiota bacterium]|nr:MAG: zinc ABC transporter substrate-binding protein [Candidatus Neomarinimicrobiota bacterium]
MKKFIVLFLVNSLFAKVNIVASITDLADIAATIGGKEVKVTAIAKGTQNPHYVEVLPSYMLKVRRADIYLKVGMELDLWSQQIIDGSRNGRVRIVDCSQNIKRLEVPTGKVDASQGDIHRLGNPHYWLDPENGVIIAETITEALSAVDPKHQELYQTNLEAFRRELESRLRRWQEEYADLQGKNIIFYHNSWPYFAQRFGLKTVGFVEDKPGIPPTPAHLNDLMEVIRQQGVRIVAMEPYFSDRAPEFLREKTGIRVVKLAQSVGALPGADSYLDLFELNLKTLQSIWGE